MTVIGCGMRCERHAESSMQVCGLNMIVVSWKLQYDEKLCMTMKISDILQHRNQY